MAEHKNCSVSSMLRRLISLLLRNAASTHLKYGKLAESVSFGTGGLNCTLLRVIPTTFVPVCQSSRWTEERKKGLKRLKNMGKPCPQKDSPLSWLQNH